MSIVDTIIDTGVGHYLSRAANARNLPHGTTRPLYYADGTPLVNGAQWVDISDPNNALVKTFYAPASFDSSFDDSFQN